MCNFTTCSNTDLVTHMRKHADVNISCQFCKFTTKDDENLREHIRIKHRGKLSAKTVSFAPLNITNHTPSKERRFSEKNKIQYCHFWKISGKCSWGNQSLGKCKKLLKATKRGGIRSRRKRINKSTSLVKFSILGTNAAGLKAKKDSLKELFNYSIFLVL